MARDARIGQQVVRLFVRGLQPVVEVGHVHQPVIIVARRHPVPGGFDHTLGQRVQLRSAVIRNSSNALNASIGSRLVVKRSSHNFAWALAR
ncbi:MAG: hypothetical protein JWR80_6028 [Bradyrhizobium sp.]|nr:hypothetical protein [Bradyrhizobium sp.]